MISPELPFSYWPHSVPSALTFTAGNTLTGGLGPVNQVLQQQKGNRNLNCGLCLSDLMSYWRKERGYKQNTTLREVYSVTASTGPVPVVMMQRFTDWHQLGNNQACVQVLVLERNDCTPVNSCEEDLFTLQHEWRGSSAHRHITLMSLEQNRSRTDRWVQQDHECVQKPRAG